MLKIFVAFIIFAAISLFVLFKSGGNISMQGEAGGHDTNQVHEAPKPASEPPAADNAAPAPAPAPSADTEKK